jgi:hypothetical protein
MARLAGTSRSETTLANESCIAASVVASLRADRRLSDSQPVRITTIGANHAS